MRDIQVPGSKSCKETCLFLRKGDELELRHQRNPDVVYDVADDAKPDRAYEKTDFIGVKYNLREDIKYDIKEIVGFLSKFIEIVHKKECFLIKYDIKYI